jgi:hypothetical protein
VNGQASLSGTSLIMNPNTGNASGSAFWPTPVAMANLHASFSLTIDQGTGADGAAFVLGNPAAGARPTMVGGSGGALGAAGIPGVAITFDTFKNGADPSNNFIGIAVSGGGLTYNQTSTAIPTLHNSTQAIDIQVAGGVITVKVGGVTKLTSTLALPTTAYVGFTGSTGGLTDRHMVTNVSIGV